jgi:hypothetical protein
VQTERQGPAGPVRLPLGGEDSPAAFFFSCRWRRGARCTANAKPLRAVFLPPRLAALRHSEGCTSLRCWERRGRRCCCWCGRR